MTEKREIEITGLCWPIFIIWVALVFGGGFKRVDCAMGVEKACNSISERYAEEASQ